MTDPVDTQAPATRPHRRATLLVSGLEAVPLLERLGSEVPAALVKADIDGTSADAAAAEVLYIPSLHLQLWRGNAIPLEANVDDDAVPELLRSAAQGEVVAHALFTGVDEYDGDICILSNLYSHNFFHFIEELYKVVILERVGFTGSYAFSTYPSRLAQALPSFSSEFLELLGIAPARQRHLTRPTLLRRAWFTTRIAHADTPRYPGVFRALRRRLIEAAAGSPGLGERLWLDRRHDRTVVNAAEVADCLARHRFTTVDMAALPVRRQIAAAHQARVLAGPHGAALIHSMFMQEAATVIECFSPTYINPCVIEICRNLGHLHLPLVPPSGPHFEYRHGGAVEVNLQHLEIVLRSLDQPAFAPHTRSSSGSS